MEHFVRSSSQKDVFWREYYKDGEDSFVSFLQLYSDKTVTTTNACGITFYPFHMNMLNYCRSYKEYVISHGHTIVAFLPTTFLKLVKEHGRERWITDNYVDRIDKMRYLHKCIEQVMEPLKKESMKGIECCTSDYHYLRAHTVIGHYCGDIEEVKNLLGVKHTNSTMQPCHRCHVPKERLHEYTNYGKRSGKETKDILRKVANLRKESEDITENLAVRDVSRRKALKVEAEDILKSQSMMNYMPILSTFPLTTSTDTFDIYKIFTVEPLHLFHLGISKLIKQCACDRLKSTEKRTYAMGGENGKTFSFIRNSVLRQMNGFLEDVFSNHEGIRINCTIRKADGKPGLNGMFKEDGIAGMVEAKIFKEMDKVSPFLGSIIDRACGEEMVAPVTKIFTMYVEIVNMFCRNEGVEKWDREQLNRAGEKVAEFKTLGYKYFGEYQKSEMCTEKWHSLDHLKMDAEEMNGLSEVSGSSYEKSHVLVKTHYRQTTGKKNNAMENTVQKLGRTMQDEGEGGGKRRKIASKTKDRNEELVENVTEKKKEAVVCRNYASVRYTDLEDIAVRLLKKEDDNVKIGEVNDEKKVSVEVEKALNGIGMEGTIYLYKLVREIIYECDLRNVVMSHVNIKLSRSFYVQSEPCPTLEDQYLNNRVFVKRGGTDAKTEKFRVYAVHDYYNTGKPRYDDVMVAATEDRKLSGRKEIWFGKALTIITITYPRFNDPDTNKCLMHGQKECEICDPKFVGEYVLLQYYDVIDQIHIPHDDIDQVLKCIKLQWAKSNDREEEYDSGKMYGLCPIESVCGRVHLVRGSHITKLLHEDVEICKKVKQYMGNSDSWESEFFYVNRFFYE